jgi:tetratricopeptide (TPR) repeat protein
MRGIPDTLEKRPSPLMRAWSVFKSVVFNVVAIWSVLASVALNAVGALLFIGISYLLYQAVTAAAIEVLPISVPESLAKQGYTSEAVTLQLREALLDLVKEAKTSKSTANVVKQDDELTVALPQTGISLDTIAAQIRAHFGVGNWWKVSGNIESDGDNLTLDISLEGEKEYKKIIVSESIHSVGELFSSAALSIYQVIDPYVVAASFMDKNPEKSIELAHQIIAMYPASDVNVAWAHILVSAVSQDPHEEVREAAAAIALQPNILAAHLDLGLALGEQGETEAATEEFKKAMAIDPRSGDAYVDFGSVLLQQRKAAAAIDQFNKAIAVDPRNADAYTYLGLALLQQRKVDEAIDQFNRALAADPRNVDAHVGLGSALRQQGKADAAIDEFNKAVAIDPKNADAHYNLGTEFQAQRNLDTAIEEFDKVIAVDPENEDAHYNLGIALKDQGKLDAAIEEYNDALDIDPENQNAHYNLGIALQAQGKFDAAIGEFQKVVAIDPKNADAYNNLGIALKDQRNFDAAIEVYMKAVAIDPAREYVHNNLGVALQAEGSSIWRSMNTTRPSRSILATPVPMSTSASRCGQRV